MAREKQPIIHIDDLHLVDDGFVHAYKATWQEAGVIATWYLDVVDRDHWQPDHYLKHAYELEGSARAASGRQLGTIQDETGSLLLRELKTQMLAAMIDVGWQQVDTTNEGQPIYQYRPAPRVAPRTSEWEPGRKETADPSADQVEPRQTRVYEVYGSEEARKSGSPPAYSRKVALKKVVFQCAVCGQTVTEDHLPGQKPSYCQSKTCQREAVRLRVARSREKKPHKQP